MDGSTLAENLIDRINAVTSGTDYSNFQRNTMTAFADNIIDAASNNSIVSGTLTVTGDTKALGKLIVGTDSNPIFGAFKVYGTAESSTSPTIEIMVDTDNYPILQHINYAHDNIGLAFDAYWDGSDWKSSDIGSNFTWYKYQDKLSCWYKAGITPGDTISPWGKALSINKLGNLEISGTTFAHQVESTQVESRSFKIGANTLGSAEWSALDGVDDSWTSFTPLWDGITEGNATNNGYYKQIGKTTFIYAAIKLGSTSSVTGAVTLTLPVSISSNYKVGTSIGMVRFNDEDSGVSYNARLRADGSIRVYVANATYLTDTALSSTVPITWAQDDVIVLTATYEAD